MTDIVTGFSTDGFPVTYSALMRLAFAKLKTGSDVGDENSVSFDFVAGGLPSRMDLLPEFGTTFTFDGGSFAPGSVPTDDFWDLKLGALAPDGETLFAGLEMFFIPVSVAQLIAAPTFGRFQKILLRGDDDLDLGDFNGRINTFGGDDRVRDFGGKKVIRGGKGDDDIATSGLGADKLFGGSGNDSLAGDFLEDISDRQFGGAGDDFLDGFAGDDFLFGGAGRDTISGQTGTDTMSGGDGADVFDYRGLDPRFPQQYGAGVGSNGRDVITDFERGVDTIDMRPSFPSFIPHTFVTGAFTEAFQIRVRDAGRDVLVQVNEDTDSGVEWEILVRNVATLTQNDIEL